jgi:short-subunit dehydrogenase
MANVAFITGASAGLGAEFARLFAAHGHDLVLVARRGDRLEALAAELMGVHEITAHVIVADLADPGSVAQVVSEAERLGLVITHLVNNAGFGSKGTFLDSEPARELAMVSLNAAAPLALTRAFLPAMVRRRRGRILNVSSMAGFEPGPYMATYHATKAFLNSFSEALSQELRGTGVTLTLSCPGTTATEFAAVAGSQHGRLGWLLHAAPAAAVAREAYEAMMAGKPLVVHGLPNRAAVQLLRLAPRAAVRAGGAFVNRPRTRSSGGR